jgi:selenocysteine lyase/cysteine desulfurase
MSLNRRDVLGGLGSLAASAAFPRLERQTPAKPKPGLPCKTDFAIPPGLTYLNGAYTHPMPAAAVDAIAGHAGRRSRPGGLSDPGNAELTRRVKEEFAALINAKPSEIAFIPNTSAGENLVVNGLGIPGGSGNVVTDALHFDGSILHLQALQRDRGLDVRMVMPKDGRIDMRDLERVVDRNTRLVELSLVAMYNGFQHDLKAVCDLAHAHGACVYADIIQAVGATPIDVKASGVDFCACAAFKWLMGDFGLGFLYAREDLLGRVVRRSQFGYHSSPDIATHFLPLDPPAAAPFTWTFGTDASAFFEVGSLAYAPMAALGVSLPFIRGLGVAAIEAHRQPLLDRLRREMPRLGFAPATPAESKSALITFVVRDRPRVLDRLMKANINVRLGDHFIRISPSVYNDLADVDRLLEALS